MVRFSSGVDLRIEVSDTSAVGGEARSYIYTGRTVVSDSSNLTDGTAWTIAPLDNQVFDAAVQAINDFAETAERVVRTIYTWNDGVHDWNRIRDVNARGEVVYERDFQVEYVYTERDAAFRAKANGRAKALLLDHLNSEQKETFETYGYFELKSQMGHWYRIYAQKTGNVVALDTHRARPVAHFCIVSTMEVPLWDQLLTQMLMLKYAERKFMEIANRM